ncbi:MAG: hypothetical protein MKZ55_04225 [Candidatus Thalassarchaeum sp.]|nr:hypothetical protein [Candidatus Thalassarchaeum sp.]
MQINRDAAPPGGWEEFTVEDRGNNVVCLKSCHGKYLSAQQNGTAQWNRDHAPRGGWEDIQFVQQGATGQQQPATTTASMPSYVIVAQAGSSEVNGNYEFMPGKHENRHWGTIAGHYQHTQNPEIFIAFQDCGTNHQRPEWNKWMIISKIGVLYAAHTGGKIGVPPREGVWETVDSWGNPGAPGGKHPAPTVRHGEQASKAATKIQQLVARRGEGPIEILEAVTGKPVRFKLNDPPNHNDAWVGIYPTGASDQDHGAQNQRWKYIRDIDVNNAFLTQQPAGDWSLRVFKDGGYTVHERKDFTIHSNLGTPASESIEILEAVTKKPVRFKINNPPTNHDAWVGIYPLMASDQDHGEENKRWKWLRNIDVNNASFPKQSEGDWSIRVFSDGGHTLHERKDFAVQAGKAEPRDPVAVQATRKNAWIALVVGIIMFGIGLPLFIASGQVNLGMLIPGAILFGVGAFSAVSAWFVLITSWSESYAVTGKPAPRWTKVAVVFAVLLLIPGAALNIIGAISLGTLHHEETSSARLSITDTDGMGDQGFIIFIEAVPGDFDNNGIHDYCENVIVNATHSGLWMSEPWTSQAKQNDADQTRQVFELEIAHDGSGCDANVWPQQKGGLVKLGRACYGCMAGYTDISASRNDNSTPMWIQDGEKVGEAAGLTIAGGIISGLSVLSLIGLGIFHSKIKANRTHARKDTSADSSYSIELEDMSFWDDITEGSEDNRSYHDKLLEKMKYPDKEEIEQDIQSGKPLQKWYSHWLHDPAKSAEIAKALGLVVGGAGYDFEGSWGTKGLYAYRSGKYSGHAYFGTGGSDEDRLEPEDDDDKYRPWDRNDPKTPENIRKIWLEIEPKLARSYYLDPPNDD